jgi:hypothetical protein
VLVEGVSFDLTMRQCELDTGLTRVCAGATLVLPEVTRLPPALDAGRGGLMALAVPPGTPIKVDSDIRQPGLLNCWNCIVMP